MKKNDNQSLTLEEKLIKLRNEYPLIPHTNAGRLSSMVRRMKAEQDMEIPINLRSAFAISVANGKHTNQMMEEEWEDFFFALSAELKRDYPEIYNRTFPLPKGLTECTFCGQYKGKTKAKYIKLNDPSGVNPNETISFSCLCDGILCSKCHINKVPRPISNKYERETNSFWHYPWFTGQMGCQECRNKK